MAQASGARLGPYEMIAAIVSLAGAATGSDKGKPFADGSKGLDVFVKRDGRWQVVYSQMTPVEPQAQPPGSDPR